MVIRCRRTC